MTPIEYFWRHAHQPLGLTLKDAKSSLGGEELYTAVRALSWRLLDKGVKRQNRVAVMCGKNASQVLGMLATWNVGAIYVPIIVNNLQSRVDYVLKDCDIDYILINDKTLLDHFKFGAIPVISLSEELQNKSSGQDITPATSSVDEEISYIIYTSGSTGQPKGVVITNSSLLCLMANASRDFQELTAPNIFLQVFEFSSDATIWDISIWLVKGGTLIVVDIGQNVFKLVKALLDYKPTYICNPATLYTLLISVKPTWAQYDFNFVKCLISAASYLPPKVALQLLESFPMAHVYNCYGPTETTVYCSWTELNSATIDESKPISIGQILPGHRAYLYDGSRLHLATDLEEDQEMELCVAGPQLFREYWKAPELTKQKILFTANSERVYRTGDLVRRKGDEFFYYGRTDDTIKIRGYRVNLGEIELCLGAVPFVTHCAVVDIPAENYGTDLLAFYTSSDDKGNRSDEEARTLRRRLEAELPSYMIPKQFVRISQFPYNSTGKIDRPALRKQIQTVIR